MKGKVLSFMVILLVALFAALICGGVALADDGGLSNPDNSINWTEVGLILGALWLIYWPALQADWADTWGRKELSTPKKIGYSLSALVGCLIPCVKTLWTQYGGAILALLKMLIRVKLGVPVAVQRVKAAARPRRL